MAFATINAYIAHLVDTDTNILLRAFAEELHTKFYKDVDTSFMNDFLDMAAQENEGKFIVHHQKLIEYGIATSGRSNNIKDRLKSLGLDESSDYLLLDVQQQVSSGTKHKKVYMLTPDAFFLALQRAQRRREQDIDPTKYAKYFQFLQKVIKYFDQYQIQRMEKLCSFKDDRIGSLIEETKRQNEKIDKLLAFGEKASEDNDELKEEISQIKDTVTHTKEKLHVVYSHLVDKSITSTMDPINKRDVHHALVMTRVNDKNEHEFKLISGQSKYIDERKRTLASSKYTPAIDKFYQANGIDFRCNVRVELNAFIDRRIETLLQEDDKCEKVIRACIKISKLSIVWKPNKYISLSSIIAIMERVKEETQAPPIKEV